MGRGVGRVNESETKVEAVTMDDVAILICAHGSRDGDAITELEALAAGMRRRLPHREIGAAYLEFARPTIREGLEALVARGARRIHALPAMLFAAGHVKNDLPWELNSFAAEHKGVELAYGRDLGIDARLLAAARARIEAAEKVSPRAIARKDTLLLVIGRGTNDPDANGNIAKIARMLWEGMGFGYATVGYSGVAPPLTPDALAYAQRLGFKRIVVFPYFLFTGVLVKRIYAATDEAAAAHPETEILKASYLNDHPEVLDTFIDHLAEIGRGENLMNCRLCKYRERLVGYESAVGTPQVGHHLHVRGIGTDADHHHDHDHDHGHGHGHDHHDHGHRRDSK